MTATNAREAGAPFRSPVYWAVLVLVSERPGYGYELLKRFEREYGEILPISSDSHIYRALVVLEKHGFVEEVPASAPPGRQPKPRYQVTPAGTRALRDSLIAQVPLVRGQSRLFARHLAGLANEPELGLEVIDRYVRACLEEAQSRAIGPTVGERSLVEGGSLAAALQAEQARLAVEVELPWARYAREQFETLSRTRVADEPA